MIDNGVRYNPTYRKVDVRSSLGRKDTCYQNKYGVSGYYDPEFPWTTSTPNGGSVGDVCMSVGVMHASVFCRGDAPASNTDWPNRCMCHPPFLSVWLR